jgi:hypothetical protein
MVSGSQKRRGDSPAARYGEQASRRALAHLLAEFERARDERDAAQARMDRFGDTISLLIPGLHPDEQAEYRQRFEAIRSGGPPQRGGELFGNVIALFKKDQRPEWTVPEAQEALEQNGVTVDDTKALYNVFTYLANTGRLQRVSRGHYAVTGGVGIVTSDEIGRDDGTQRVTEHDV